jgi:hypothetical protein
MMHYFGLCVDWALEPVISRHVLKISHHVPKAEEYQQLTRIAPLRFDFSKRKYNG